ncbi:MAG TPA: fatty acid desaturase [Geminicoccaceae bacterium]|nr:fatty acid desaturase [Geminicoccaceae bacterium]
MQGRQEAIYATTAAAAGDRRALLRLSARSDARGLVQLALHLAALLATGGAVALARGSLWLAPVMLLHGLVLVFLFAPLHETIHRTAFKSRRLNDAVAFVCGAVLILPPEYFRAFHFAHHRHTQDPERDPELITAKPVTVAGYLWQVSGLPYWGERITTTVRHARGRVDEPFVARHLRPRVVREARWLLGVYALLALGALLAGSAAPLLFWLVPGLLGQPFLRMYLLAEHTGCPLVPEMLRNSRTTRSIGLVRRLAWNMPYHAEHHAHPALPFHALPAAHALLKDRIAVQAPGYVAVQREILSTLEGRPEALARRP